MTDIIANVNTGVNLEVMPIIIVAIVVIVAIAAAVIGGVSMSGGSGSVFGTLIGAVTVAIIRNGLVLLGVQSYFTQIVVGAIIVVAVSIDFIRKRIAASR